MNNNCSLAYSTHIRHCEIYSVRMVQTVSVFSEVTISHEPDFYALVKSNVLTCN